MDADQYAVPPQDRAVLLEAIGRVTGLDRPFQEHPPPGSWWGRDDDPTPEPPDGVAVQVLGGVVDEAFDRVAWVERYTFPPDEDWIDGFVGVWLNLAGEGTLGLPRIEGWVYQEPKPQVSVRLAPDRPDKVTAVEYVQFFDSPECLVVVYDWAGFKRLLRLTLSAPGLHGIQAHGVDLGNGTAVVVDGKRSWDQPTLCYHRDSYPLDDELVYGLRLPDLTPTAPISAPRLTAGLRYAGATLSAGAAGTVRWTERWDDDGRWRAGRTVDLRLPGRSQSGLVDDPSVGWDRLRAALGDGAPPDGPDILIGALAVPFWDPTGPTSPGGRGDVWAVLQGPWWFPAGWHHYLRTSSADGGGGRPAEAAAWLRWLDQLDQLDRLDRLDDGEQNRKGWDEAWSREDGSTRFALAHLRRQAGALAAACRAGEVPVLGDFGTWRKPPVLSAAPPGFARAWRELPERFRAGSFPVEPSDQPSRTEQ